MDKNLVKKIQKQIADLLPSEKQHQLGVLLADSCSEVSQLVAGWIKSLDETDQITILKGTNIFGTEKSHDLLAVTTTDKQIYIIDPTVWQFFPQADSILMFIENDLTTALEKLEKMYNGQWAESGKFTSLNKDEERKYLDTIYQNIYDNGVPTTIRAAAAIIKDNKILLIHRFNHGEEYYVLPGGGVETGETTENTAIREAKEETGLDIKIAKKLWEHPSENDHRMHHVFLVTDFNGESKLGGVESKINNPTNSYVLEWHDLDKISALTIYPLTTKERILNYKF